MAIFLILSLTTVLKNRLLFKTACVVSILFMPFIVLAQHPLSNWRVVKLKIARDTLLKDSLTIIPHSVKIEKTGIDSLKIQKDIEIKNNSILLKNAQKYLNDSLIISYRVLPFNLSAKKYHLDSSRLDPLAPTLPVEFEYTTDAERNAPIFEKGLEYNGTYTQGLSLGNAQNLVVNQNFNLNLAGKLGDLDVLASMTDNNLPIQAEGNTQSLREIDKIFIQLKKGTQTLVIGDHELNRPNNAYFLNYAKKLQGLAYSNNQSFLIKKSLTTTQTAQNTMKANLGIARGKFARNILPSQEGNQGPYKLLGTEGASYFIILSGTEKVYFDGKLLVRGDENDYIMDYNRGDITFTPKRLVTKDSRIVVEFEYADQSYLRSTASLTNELKYNKLRFNFNFYSEQDSKNSTGVQSLDSLDKAYLRKAGNDFALNPPLSIKPLDEGFNSDRIQYKLIDTVVQGQRYASVLVYSANPDSAKYTASFIPVGEGKGNYIQAKTAVNGRVYEWVAPTVNGASRGSFEPIKRLVPPNKQQMMTLGAHYQLSSNTQIFTEIAMTNNDKNRFSALGDSTNIGWGLFSGIIKRMEWGTKKAWSLETAIKTEWTQKNFKTLNPYRAAEFTRDWNIGSASGTTNSTIGNLNPTASMAASEFFLLGGLKLAKNNMFSAQYDFSAYQRQLLYKGQRHAGRFNFDKNDWHIAADMSLLKTDNPVALVGGMAEKTQFLRPKLDISKSFKKGFKIGIQAEREKNQRFDAVKDTLTRASFYYDLWRAYFEKNTEGGNTWGFNYSERIDYLPFSSQFLQASKVNELNLNGTLNKRENSQLSWNISYRDLKIGDTTRTNLKAQETYLGRLEYNFNAFKNAIYGNTLYEIGSGQEQKLEYQYIKVNKGEGQYVWRNRNADTIPQLDEFEIAPFQDQADYVRVTLLTNQFVRTNNVSFSQSLRFDPRNLWQDKTTGAGAFFRRFSTNSALLINRRVKNDDPSVSQWNPFEWGISDKSLVALNISMRHSLFFNRSSPVWDIELGQLQNRNRSILVTGYEERQRDEIFMRHRLNLGRYFSLQNYIAQGHQVNNSEAFLNRNYTLSLFKIEPELTCMPHTDFRIVAAYKYKNGINILKTPGETIKNQDISAEATWNQSANSQFRTKMAWVKVDYTGERNTPIEFALLEGLQNGNNYLWSLSLDRLLSKNIFLNISYEGRKTGVVRVVHVGRASVRASF